MSFLKAISNAVLLVGGRRAERPKAHRIPAAKEPITTAPPTPEAPEKKPDPTRHIYLIDTENTAKRWLDFSVAQGRGEFHLFYTDNSPKLSLSELPKVAPLLSRIQLHQCVTGPNALDFQLVAYLAFQLGKGASGDTYYHIVSNDTGYKAAIRELSRLSPCRVNRMTVTKALDLSQTRIPLPAEKLEQVRSLLSDIPDSEREGVLRILYENRLVAEMVRPTEIHNVMQTAFSGDKATAYYHALKPRLKEIYQIINSGASPEP